MTSTDPRAKNAAKQARYRARQKRQRGLELYRLWLPPLSEDGLQALQSMAEMMRAHPDLIPAQMKSTETHRMKSILRWTKERDNAAREAARAAEEEGASNISNSASSLDASHNRE